MIFESSCVLLVVWMYLGGVIVAGSTVTSTKHQNTCSQAPNSYLNFLLKVQSNETLQLTTILS